MDQTYAEAQTFVVPSGLSGTFYLFGFVDKGERVYERGSEANNVAFDALAMLITESPPADLVAGTITIPANGVPGQSATITYTVHNQGANPALGRWFDSLYLSADDQWDLSDKLFGRVEYSGDVPGGAGYTETLTAPVPGVKPGDYHLIVRSDIRNHIPESDETNNVGASLDRTAIDVEVLVPGVPAVGTLGTGQSVYYRIDVAAGGTLLVTLDGDSATSDNELYVRFGDIPRRSLFDFTGANPFLPDQEIVVPLTRGGTYYVLAFGGSVSGSPGYTITAEVLAFSVRAVEPERVGNAGPVTLMIEGAQYTQDTVFQLIGPAGVVIDASGLFMTESSAAFATFDLTGQPVGLYDVRAIDAGGAVETLENALTVESGTGPLIAARLTGPSTIRPDSKNIFYITYANVGDGDAVAPLFLVDNNVSTTPIGFSPDSVLPRDRLQVSGVGFEGPGGILRPGQRYRIPIYFHNLVNVAHAFLNFELFTMTVDDDRPIDWEAFEAAVRPDNVPDDEWDEAFARIRQRIGLTWGDYVRTLAEVTTLLSGRGHVVFDPKVLFYVVFLQETGNWTSVVSGRLIDADTGQLIGSTPIVARAEVETGDPIIRTAVTDKEGKFTLVGLPPATYQLFVEGYFFSETTTATVTTYTDVTGLTLFVHAVPPEPLFEPKHINQSDASLVLDASGTPTSTAPPGSVARPFQAPRAATQH